MDIDVPADWGIADSTAATSPKYRLAVFDTPEYFTNSYLAMSNTTIVDRNTDKCASNTSGPVPATANVSANNDVFDSNTGFFLENVKFWIDF